MLEHLADGFSPHCALTTSPERQLSSVSVSEGQYVPCGPLHPFWQIDPKKGEVFSPLLAVSGALQVPMCLYQWQLFFSPIFFQPNAVNIIDSNRSNTCNARNSPNSSISCPT